jgi:hypothetical protein
MMKMKEWLMSRTEQNYAVLFFGIMFFALGILIGQIMTCM